jgi:hypothetical protein
MQALSTFLANHIVNKEDFNEEDYNDMLLWMKSYVHNGIQLYKKHLQEDIPRTVGWMMVEKQLVIALEHMEDPAKSAKERGHDAEPK